MSEGENDPLIGKKASGVVVFGGGLALYDGDSIVGTLGVSGDTSGRDHNVTWRVHNPSITIADIAMRTADRMSTLAAQGDLR